MVSIKWALTNSCNLNCKTCYNADLRNIKDNINIKTLIPIFDEMKNMFVDEFQILGGEPLLYADLESFLIESKKRNIRTSITTNGILLSNNLNILKYIDKLTISLDGPEASINDFIRGSGNYDIVVNTFELIKKSNPNIKLIISSVLHKLAIDNLPKYITFLDNYPMIDEISFSLPSIEGNAKLQENSIWVDNEYYIKYISDFASIMPQKYSSKFHISGSNILKWKIDQEFKTNFLRISNDFCMGASLTYYIDSDGIVYPCNQPKGIKYFRQMHSYEILKLENNIMNSKYFDIISDKKYQLFFEFVRDKNYKMHRNPRNIICDKCYFYKNNLCATKCPLDEVETLLDFCQKISKDDKQIMNRIDCFYSRGSL